MSSVNSGQYRASATSDTVVSVTAAESRAGTTFYHVMFTMPSGSAQPVWRRFSEFVALRQLLSKQPAGSAAHAIQRLPFPKKTTLKSTGKSAKVVEARRQALDTWIRAVFTALPEDDIVRGFLNQELLRDEVQRKMVRSPPPTTHKSLSQE
jgi:hypothetical protein